MSWARILWVFTVLGFQNEAAYRANFWVQIFESVAEHRLGAPGG